VVASGSWTPSSGVSSKWGIWGKRENKATVSTHPKYSASKDLYYICNIINGEKAVNVDWAAAMPE
jgi:hypothetical protein